VWIDFMKNRLADLEDKPWVQPERLIRVKLDAITGKVATDDSDDIVEEEIETEQKSRIVAADKEDKTGFEVFNNIPPEVLVPKRQSRRKSKRNNNDRNSRSNNSNTSASTPKRSAPTTPERVEIPEQLF
jgi:membrane carboxypeptidase/penicillin-binding protein